MMKLTPRNVLMIFWIAYAVGVIMTIVGILMETGAVFPVGIGIVIAAAVFRLLFYRCPHCGGYLDRNAPSGFCPHCGKKIEE